MFSVQKISPWILPHRTLKFMESWQHWWGPAKVLPIKLLQNFEILAEFWNFSRILTNYAFKYNSITTKATDFFFTVRYHFCWTGLVSFGTPQYLQWSLCPIDSAKCRLIMAAHNCWLTVTYRFSSVTELMFLILFFDDKAV